MCIHTLGYLAFYSVKGATTDKQYITRIHRNILLIRMLTASLRRYIDYRALQQFQQSLLYAFTTHVTGNARVVRLTSYLVNLVNKDDASLRSFHIIICHLQQTGKDTLDVLTNVACLCEYSSIYYRKRHIQHLRNSTSQQGLTRSRRTDHDNVRFLYLNTIFVCRLLQSFVMVINCYGKETFCLILTYHILIKVFFDFFRFWQTFHFKGGSSLLCIRAIAISSCHLISLHCTVFTDTTIHSSYQELNLFF